MRAFRFFIGLGVVLLALWVLIGEQLSGASADATINARVVVLRSPVAGTLDVPVRALGSRVSRGEVLAEVSDPLVDAVRLDDLAMEMALAEADVARIAAHLAATEAAITEQTERAQVYKAARRAELSARLDHARAVLALLGSDTPSVRAEEARERVAVLEIAVQTAEGGVFLGEGYNDAPFAEQRLAQLRVQASDQRADHAAATARVATLAARRDAETLRVNRASGGEITAPVDGLYWQPLASDGESIQRGDPVARLVDCGSTVVTASVSAAVYNRLTPGTQAGFRPRGGGAVLSGSIERLAGAGAATVYETLAVAPSQKHLQRYDVLISVPTLRGDPALSCAVGRTGRVFFDVRPLDWLGVFGD